MMPNDLPPWHTVYQQTQRWLTAGVFEEVVHDLRRLLRVAAQQTETVEKSKCAFALLFRSKKGIQDFETNLWGGKGQ